MGRFVILPLRLHFTDLPAGPDLTILERLIELRGGYRDSDAPPPASGAPATSPAIQAIPGALDPFSYAVTQRIGEQLTAYNDAPHTGADFAMPEGQPVAALRHGRVVQVIQGHRAAGNFITVAYDDGVWATFAHLSGTGATYEGQEVYPDTTIGYIGQTGLATGPHLHLELHTRGGYLGTTEYLVDPLRYFLPFS